jgi:hypothetical protein
LIEDTLLSARAAGGQSFSQPPPLAAPSPGPSRSAHARTVVAKLDHNNEVDLEHLPTRWERIGSRLASSLAWSFNCCRGVARARAKRDFTVPVAQPTT